MKAAARRRPAAADDDDESADDHSTNPFADDADGTSSGAGSNPFAAATAPPPSASASTAAAASSSSSAMASYYAQLAAPAPGPAPPAPAAAVSNTRPSPATASPSFSNAAAASSLSSSSSSSQSVAAAATAAAGARSSPEFSISVEWKATKEHGSVVHLAAGNDVVCIGTSNNFLLRLNFVQDQKDAVLLSKRVDDRIHRVFVDPWGHHCLVSMANGVVHYLHANWTKSHTLSKLKGLLIDSVAWNHIDGANVASSGKVLLGSSRGLIFELVLDEKEKDRSVKKLFDLSEGGDAGGAAPICGLHMELFPDLAESEPDRFLIIAATPTRQYQFIGGPTFEKVFERYAAQPAFLELPGDLGYSELRCFSKYAEPTNQPTGVVAWLTGAGVYYGELRFGQQHDVGEHVLEDGKLLAYPQEPGTGQIVPALSLVLSEWHFLLLTPSRLIAINQLSQEIVYEETFDVKSTGELLGLAFDAALGVIWLYAARCVLEIKIENEDSEMWRLFLQLGRYDEALRYTTNDHDAQLVLNAQADYAFDCRHYQLAAKLYAKTQRAFEEIALKFVQLSSDKHSTQHQQQQQQQTTQQPNSNSTADGSHSGSNVSAAAAPSSSGAASAVSSSVAALDARSALKIYLLEKLETLPPTDLTQQTMICTWLTEIFLDNINSLQDPPPTPALTDAAEQRQQQLAQSAPQDKSAAEDDGLSRPSSNTSFSPFRAVSDGSAAAPAVLPHNGRPGAVASRSAVSPSAVSRLDDDPFSSLSADERGDLLDAEIAAFRRFLRERNDCLNRATTIELLSSHGRMDEWLLYAKDDLEWVLSQLMQDAQYDQALSLLRKHGQPAKVAELFYKIVPALITHRPQDCIDLLVEVKGLDPAKLIPALMRYEEHFDAAQQAAAIGSTPALSQSPAPRGLALKYLEHCVYRQRNRDPVVHNYLISLYAAERDAQPFLRYLDSQKQQPVFDTQYALRLCYEHGQQQGAVAIYSMMRLYEEAVQLALTFDIPLAKRVIQQAERTVDVGTASAAGAVAGAGTVGSSAPLSAHDVHPSSSVSPSIDASTAKRLWLLVARQIISTHSSSISTAMSLLKDCGSLSLEDLLPFFPDFVRIGELKDEIARSLDAYNAAIEALQADMEQSTAAAQAIRHDLQSLKQRSGAVAINRKCDLCGLPVLSASFLLFPCTHCYHTDCAKSELQRYWEQHPAMRKKAIAERVQREKEKAQHPAHPQHAQQAQGPVLPQPAEWATLSKQAKEARVLSDCVASECCLCGGVMIDSVQLPFVAEQEPSELREVETWRIS